MLFLLSKRFVVQTSKVLYLHFLYVIPFYVRGGNEQIRNEIMKLLRRSCGGGGGMLSSSGGKNQQRRVTRAVTEPSPREKGDDGPPLAARVHNNQILSQHQW